MMPMWASYIVKAYAWTLLLAKGGVAQWFVQHLGLEPVLQFILGIPGVGGSTLSTSHLGRFMVFVYIWLPFMILPIQASLERLPPSLLQASADLGAKPRQTFMQVILPLSVPGIAAGSIFTFFADLGRLHRAATGGPAGLLRRQHGLRATGCNRQHADGRSVHAGADRADRHLPVHRQTSGGLRCTLKRLQ